MAEKTKGGSKLAEQITNEDHDKVTKAQEEALVTKAKAETTLKRTKDEAKKCPVSREEFLANAKPSLPVTIDGQAMGIGLKEFASGSYGWFGNGQITMTIDGKPVKFQVQVQAVAVGSAPKK